MFRHLLFFCILFLFPVFLSAAGNKTGFHFPGAATSFISFDVQALRRLPYADIFFFDKEIRESSDTASRTALLYTGKDGSAIMQDCAVTADSFRQRYKDFSLAERNGILTAQKEELMISMIGPGRLLIADQKNTDEVLSSLTFPSPAEPYLSALPDDCTVYAVLDVPDELKSGQDWKYISKIAFSLKRESSGALPNRMTILLFPNSLPDAPVRVHAFLTSLVNQAYADAEKKGSVTFMMRLWYQVVPRKDHSALLVTLEDNEAKAFLTMIFENMSFDCKK